MTLLDKKNRELTAEDIQALAKPIGVEGLAYPMVRYTQVAGAKGKNGEMKQETAVIDSLKEAMTIYTEMDIEKVQGKLFREMPIPSMLPMLRDLLAKQSPASTNRIFTVFGDPAFGKSYLFKSFSSIIHPQGAIQVDCGGMNMREIFFRTVIDYGTGVQDVLNKRLADGKISRDTVEYLNDAFPGSIVTKNCKSSIDWARIGAPKTEEKDGKIETVEDRGEAMMRGNLVLKNVYEREGISHLSNSFGIKTVPGEFFEALWNGRPLFLDEFNKSKKGTLDCWQTALQVLNGEEASATIYNPMAQAGGEDLKFLTINRSDFKTAFVVGVAGNETKDGDTTHELSESMMGRLNPMYVGNPQLEDWEHRISQIWTGLPLATLHTLHQEFAANKPDLFAQAMLDLRKLGLDARETAAIPNAQLYFLKNWPETLKAVRQVAAYHHFRQSLSHTDSQLFDKKEYTDLADEINNDALAKRIGNSFRKCIAEYNKAIESAPEARVSKGLTIDIQAAFRGIQASGGAAFKAPGWHRFGANLSNAIIEDIMNVTKDMPLTRDVLITQCTINGIIPPSFKEAKPGPDAKVLSELMRYDELKALGGTDELRAMQGVIMTALRAMQPNLKSSDDQVVPLANLGRAMQALREEKAANSNVKHIIVPNDDLNQVAALPLVKALAASSYKSDAGKDGGLINFHSLLAALAIPEYGEKNREKLWLDDFLEMVQQQQSEAMDEGEKELYNILSGKAGQGFNLAIAAATDSKGKPAYLYIVEDRPGERTMIVGPEKIPVQLLSALDKNTVTYLARSDSDTKTRIDIFLTDGAKERHAKKQITSADSNQVVERLITAFGKISHLPKKFLWTDKNGDEMVKTETTLGMIITNSTEEPLYYKRFAKMKK